jgi:hypothetical protein
MAFFHNNYSTRGELARIITADPTAPVPGPVVGAWPAGPRCGMRRSSRLVATAEEDRLSTALTALLHRVEPNACRGTPHSTE